MDKKLLIYVSNLVCVSVLIMCYNYSSIGRAEYNYDGDVRIKGKHSFHLINHLIKIYLILNAVFYFSYNIQIVLNFSVISIREAFIRNKYIATTLNICLKLIHHYKRNLIPDF